MARLVSSVLRFAWRTSLLLSATWLELTPRPAQAQVYPCPAGPSPGERMVGSRQGGQGVSSVPMCAADAQPDSDYRSADGRGLVIPPAPWPENLTPGWGMVVTFTNRKGKEAGKNSKDAYVAVVNQPTSDDAFTAAARECLARVMPGHESECPHRGDGSSATTLAYVTVYRWPSGEHTYQITNEPDKGRNIPRSTCESAQQQANYLKIAKSSGIECPIEIVEELVNGTPKEW